MRIPLGCEPLACAFLYVLSLTVLTGMMTLTPLGYPDGLVDGAYYYIVQHGYTTLSPPSTSLFPWPPLLFIVAAIPAWVLGLTTLQTVQVVYPALLSLAPVLVYITARTYTGTAPALAGGVYAALSPAQLLSFGYTYYKFAFAQLVLLLMLAALVRFEQGGRALWLGAACALLLALMLAHPAVAGVGVVLLVLTLAKLKPRIRIHGLLVLALWLVGGAALGGAVGGMYLSGLEASIWSAGYFVSPLELVLGHPAVMAGLTLGLLGAALAIGRGGVMWALAVVSVLLVMNAVLGVVFYSRYLVLADLLMAVLMPLGLAFLERHTSQGWGAYGVLAVLLMVCLPPVLAPQGGCAPSCDEVGAYAYLSRLNGTVLTDEVHAPWACALSGMDCPMLPFDARREQALAAYYHERVPALPTAVYVVAEKGSYHNATKLLDTGAVQVMRAR
ncbi:MAG: hypothetical protein ACXQS9_01885 [Methermicoccaceae archaeon]